MESVDGVKSATTEFASKTATVHGKGKVCEPEGEESLLEALRGIGYDGEILEVN